jgi:hypothetical protein
VYKRLYHEVGICPRAISYLKGKNYECCYSDTELTSWVASEKVYWPMMGGFGCSGPLHLLHGARVGTAMSCLPSMRFSDLFYGLTQLQILLHHVNVKYKYFLVKSTHWLERGEKCTTRPTLPFR